MPRVVGVSSEEFCFLQSNKADTVRRRVVIKKGFEGCDGIWIEGYERYPMLRVSRPIRDPLHRPKRRQDWWAGGGAAATVDVAVQARPVGGGRSHVVGGKDKRIQRESQRLAKGRVTIIAKP